MGVHHGRVAIPTHMGKGGGLVIKGGYVINPSLRDVFRVLLMLIFRRIFLWSSKSLVFLRSVRMLFGRNLVWVSQWIRRVLPHDTRLIEVISRKRSGETTENNTGPLFVPDTVPD